MTSTVSTSQGDLEGELTLSDEESVFLNKLDRCEHVLNATYSR